MITLRPAAAADAPVLGRLFADSRRLLTFLPELHSREEDQAFIRDHVLADLLVTVAEVDGRVAGFMAERPGWIDHLYVAPDVLRGGIGSALLGRAQSRSEEIDLWCFRDNLSARAFYERHGFRAVEATDGRGNEAGAPDIRYRWVSDRG